MLPTAARVRRLIIASLGLLTFAACSAKLTAPPEPPISMRRADEAFRFEEYDSAINAYRLFVDQFERSEYTARAFYKMALAQFRLKRYHEALITLDELAERYPNGRWVQIETLRGDTERSLDHPIAAMRAWDDAWQIATDGERRRLRPRVIVLAQALNDVDLARARRAVSSDEVAEVLEEQMGAREAPPISEPLPGEDEDVGSEEPAPELLRPEDFEQPEAPIATTGSPQREPEEPQFADGASAEDEELNTEGADLAAVPADLDHLPVADRRLPQAARAAQSQGTSSGEEQVEAGAVKIGCLLPLSGPFRDYGERSLRGLRLLFGTTDERLVIKDSGSDPASTVAAFQDLVRDPNVLVTIGPLRSEESEAIASLAERAHLPVLVLSQRDGLGSHYVLQAGMTRARQVRKLLEYAMGKMRLKRFGVVYPKDSFGNEFLSAFRDEVQRRGGAVVGAESYTAGVTSASVNLDAVRRWRKTENLQAVFLPDRAIAAADFAKFLQREMPDITLLGVQGWSDLAHGDGQTPLNGVLFADGFYVGSERPATREFVEQYQGVYGQIPGVLEAQAYDAAVLVQRALATGPRTRRALLEALQGLGVVEAATGALQLSPNGVERELFLLQVYDGQVREIDRPAG